MGPPSPGREAGGLLKHLTVKNGLLRGSVPKLPPNQVDVLSRLAMGETVVEIAASWGVSRTVVYRNWDRARQTLNARNGLHAVVLWQELSLEERTTPLGCPSSEEKQARDA